MLIHRVTRCLPQPTRYGGRNRSEQISECLRNSGAEIAEIDFFTPRFSERFENLKSGFSAWRQLPLPFDRNYRTLWTLGRFIRMLEAASATPGILVWENTDDHLLGWAARHLGWKIVAFPHNLNSLYNCSHLSTDDRLALLEKEIVSLRWADAIFSIAPDENNFFRLCGLAADQLPYHPAADFVAELAALGNTRAPTPQGPILILGSANNLHTRDGMIRQLEAIASFPSEIQKRFIVGGDATDTFAKRFPNLPVEFAGRLSTPRLNDLLTNISALWIVQEAGTGVVTRVRDFTLARIPVIANSVAARSWEQTPGVIVLDDLTALPKALEQLTAIDPKHTDVAPSVEAVKATLTRLAS